MDKDTYLHWQGPIWFAGRKSPANAGDIPGLTVDVDLLECFSANDSPPDALPAAILVDFPALDPVDQGAFFSWLTAEIGKLNAEVPLIYLCSSQDNLPDQPKAHATVNGMISDDFLFSTICAHQRALMRVEEARIRRLVLGRVPGYGAAAHYRGASGLLVVGLGGRFLELQKASGRKVEVIGAFGQDMAENFLSQRAFDAVILDSTLDETLESLRALRMDARFAALPVVVVTDHSDDCPLYFRAGANDVLTIPLNEDNLRKRLETAIRFGKRRRLADKVLAESHKWLLGQLGTGGVYEDDYRRYLERAGTALKKRGLELYEMKLLPESFAVPEQAIFMADDLYGTVLSIADAVSREEDLVCVVHDVGPVAVLKNELGQERLRSRINAILGHTEL